MSCTRDWRIVFCTLLFGILSFAGLSAQAAPPVATMSSSDGLGGGVAPWTVSFTARDSQCAPYSCEYQWNFGDGTTSGTPSTKLLHAHTYKFPGNYTVTLTVIQQTPGNPKPTATATRVINVQQGETLASYVNTCKQELLFNDADIPTNLSCAKGFRFATEDMGAQVNDFLVYARVTDSVDLAVACRWLRTEQGDFEQTAGSPFLTAASAEMIIHNRFNGKTCFFKAREGAIELPDGTLRSPVVPVDLVSPTVAALAPPNSHEADYWDPPIQIDRHLPCVDCHVAGPYIATPRIAPFLSRFGLLNNGHDTFGLTRNSQNNIVGNYHMVGSTFTHFKEMAADFNVPANGCSDSCHSIGLNSTADREIRGFGILLPALRDVIDINGTENADVSVNIAGVMPANNPSVGTADTSHYTWINRDTPGSDAVEIETLTASKQRFHAAGYCGVPTVLVAHTVGSTAHFSTADAARLPDKLRTFNTREGLVCAHADQANGKQCNNYSVRYQCSDGSWTSVYNVDSPGGTGDFENRSGHANVCTSQGLTAVAIEATTIANGAPVVVNGPSDRLAQFSPTGLVCRNSEQPNGGQCSNYVVQYRACQLPQVATVSKLRNGWVNPPTFGDRYLTTTSTVNGAETRAQANNYQYPSQDWIIEVISGSTVRLKDVWSGKYLTASSNNDQATVLVQNLDTGLTRQRWIIENVSGSTTEKRLKNAGSNRYLTVGNYTTDPYYAPMYSQSLNTSWTSQRWVIE